MKKLLTAASVALVAMTSMTNAHADEAAAGGGVSTNFSASASASPSSGDGAGTTLPLVVGALGIAQVATGIILVAAAPDTPSNCNEDTRTCGRKPGQSDASLREDQEQAGESQHMPTLGAIAVVSGAVFLAAGVAMYFWYKPQTTRSGRVPAIVPYAGASGGGLAALARF